MVVGFCRLLFYSVPIYEVCCSVNWEGVSRWRRLLWPPQNQNSYKRQVSFATHQLFSRNNHIQFFPFLRAKSSPMRFPSNTSCTSFYERTKTTVFLLLAFKRSHAPLKQMTPVIACGRNNPNTSPQCFQTILLSTVPRFCLSHPWYSEFGRISRHQRFRFAISNFIRSRLSQMTFPRIPKQTKILSCEEFFSPCVTRPSSSPQSRLDCRLCPIFVLVVSCSAECHRFSPPGSLKISSKHDFNKLHQQQRRIDLSFTRQGNCNGRRSRFIYRIVLSCHSLRAKKPFHGWLVRKRQEF